MMLHARGADFVVGFTFWLRGWGHLLRHKSLRRWAWIPFFISGFATLGVGYFLFGHLGEAAHAVLDWMQLSPRMHGINYYLLLVAASALVVVLLVYGAYIFQTIVAIPFHSLLAETTLDQLGKRQGPRLSLKQWIRRSLKIARIGFAKAVLFLFFGIILFVFSFLPLLNLLAFAGVMLLIAFDCMDYSFEALDFSLRQRFTYLGREWAQWLGMATALALTLFLPGLTLLVVPGAVVGAALIIKAERR